MTANLTNTLETWGVLLVSGDGEQILLERENENWCLPRVEIPTQERIAANINRVMRRVFGIPVISLYPVVPMDSDAPAGNHFHAVAALRQRALHSRGLSGNPYRRCRINLSRANWIFQRSVLFRLDWSARRLNEKRVRSFDPIGLQVSGVGLWTCCGLMACVSSGHSSSSMRTACLV